MLGSLIMCVNDHHAQFAHHSTVSICSMAGRAAATLSLLLAVPNVTAHLSTASVPSLFLLDLDVAL